MFIHVKENHLNFFKDQWTPLMYACRDGRLDAIQELCEAGADIEHRDTVTIHLCIQYLRYTISAINPCSKQMGWGDRLIGRDSALRLRAEVFGSILRSVTDPRFTFSRFRLWDWIEQILWSNLLYGVHHGSFQISVEHHERVTPPHSEAWFGLVLN